MHEVDEAAQMIADVVDPSANIIFGATIDEDIQDEIQITVLATGFGANDQVMPTASRMRRPVIVQDDTDEPEDDTLEKPQSTNTEIDVDLTPEKNSKEKPSIPEVDAGGDDDELDVPAFLRRSK
jgi:cell division protein FtsZ